MKFIVKIVLVLIVPFVFAGCRVSGGAFKKCEIICTHHGGIKFMEPTLGKNICFCNKNNVRSDIFETLKSYSK